MTVITADPDTIQVRLAKNEDEIRAAQRLRYKVFYEEYGAKPSEEVAREKRDMDEYDAVADHLIVVEKDSPGNDEKNIVGTYRLLRREIAEKHGRFYTSDEYDIQPLLKEGGNLLELGRSCVLEPYRTRPVLKKLWQGISEYVVKNNVDLMFGCASMHGTDPEALAPQLSYLYHYHLASEHLCPRAIDERYIEMNTLPKDQIDPRAAFSSLPPLIKGYLRLGADIGNGAVVDHQFNTTDVCIVLPTEKLSDKYMRHYDRLNQQSAEKTGVDDKIDEALSEIANGTS